MFNLFYGIPSLHHNNTDKSKCEREIFRNDKDDAIIKEEKEGFWSVRVWIGESNEPIKVNGAKS